MSSTSSGPRPGLPSHAQSFHSPGQARESGRSRIGRFLGLRSGGETTPYSAAEQGDRESSGSGPAR